MPQSGMVIPWAAGLFVPGSSALRSAFLLTIAEVDIFGISVVIIIDIAGGAIAIGSFIASVVAFLKGRFGGKSQSGRSKTWVGTLIGTVFGLAVLGVGLWSSTQQPNSPTFPLPASYKFESVSLVSADEAWAVGDDGLIAHYRNSGWVMVTSPTPSKTLTGVAMTGPGEGWAVGADGLILHCSAGIWSVYKQPSPGAWYRGIAMVSSTDGWIVGDAGGLLHYQDGQWGAVSSGTSADLFGIAMTSPQDGWAVGQGGTLLHYTGSQWTPEANRPVLGATLNAVAAAGPADVWAAGDNGVVLHFDGATWRAIASGVTSESLHGAAILANGGAWIVGQNGTLLQATASSGSTPTLTLVPGPSTAFLIGVSILPNGQAGWTVGDGALWRYTDGGWFPYSGQHP